MCLSIRPTNSKSGLISREPDWPQIRKESMESIEERKKTIDRVCYTMNAIHMAAIHYYWWTLSAFRKQFILFSALFCCYIWKENSPMKYMSFSIMKIQRLTLGKNRLWEMVTVFPVELNICYFFAPNWKPCRGVFGVFHFHCVAHILWVLGLAIFLFDL